MEKLDIAKNHKQNHEIPSNIEAEQHLLGSVLVNNDIIDEIANIINSEKFYDPFSVDGHGGWLSGISVGRRRHSHDECCRGRP